MTATTCGHTMGAQATSTMEEHMRATAPAPREPAEPASPQSLPAVVVSRAAPPLGCRVRPRKGRHHDSNAGAGQSRGQPEHRARGSGNGHSRVPGIGWRSRTRPSHPHVPDQGSRPADPARIRGELCLRGLPAPRRPRRPHEAAGGSYFACPTCLASRRVEPSNMLHNAEPGGTVQLREWIGAERATTFSY